jgi:hypothetical protein
MYFTPIIPQDLRTTASPSFVGMTVTGLTASEIVGTSAGKALVSIPVIGSGLTLSGGNLYWSWLGIDNLSETPDEDSMMVWNGPSAGVLWESGNTLNHTLGLGTEDSPTFVGLTLTGTLGVTGLSTLTGGVTLGAGTTTVWPLRFQSGPLLTTPVAGTVEFLSDIYYGTMTTGPTRKKFSYADVDYGGMFTYNKAVSLSISATDLYHPYYAVAAGDVEVGLTDGWTFDAGRLVDSDITSEADNGSGLLRIVTSANHLLTTGDTVVITDANDSGHNSPTRVTVIDATTFDCLDIAYVAGAGASSAVVEEPAYLQITDAVSQIFHLHWSVTANAALASKQYMFEPVQSTSTGIIQLDNAAAQATFGSTTSNCVSGHGLISVDSGDRIWFCVMNVTDATNITVKHFNFVVSRQ